MNSGWVICSMIQIELLSKTLASSSDFASWGLAKTRFPPLAGVPALAELVLLLLAGPPAEEVALDPQPASATMAQPTLRAMVNAGRCLTSSSGVSRGDRVVAAGWREIKARPCARAKAWAKVCANLCPTMYVRVPGRSRVFSTEMLGLTRM